MARVTVLYFAGLREQRGEQEEVEIESGLSAGALYTRLFPPGPDGSLPVAFSVNADWANADTVLTDGDELALLPPLGGG